MTTRAWLVTLLTIATVVFLMAVAWGGFGSRPPTWLKIPMYTCAAVILVTSRALAYDDEDEEEDER